MTGADLDSILDPADLDALERGEVPPPRGAPGQTDHAGPGGIAAPGPIAGPVSERSSAPSVKRPEVASPDHPELNGEHGPPMVEEAGPPVRTPSLADLAREAAQAEPPTFREPPPLRIVHTKRPARRLTREQLEQRLRESESDAHLDAIGQELEQLRRDLGRA